MSEKEGYEVIKFVERGNDCYIVSDYVEGVTLYHWIQLHKELEKVILNKWIRELIRQLSLFRRQKDNPKYTYLNPHCIVITEEKEIMLFYPGENVPRLKGKFAKQFQSDSPTQDVDLYCLGRTIQFIMAHEECVPHLKKREEIRLLTFIKKCLESNPKKQLKNIFSLEKKSIKKKIKWIPIVLGSAIFVIGITVFTEKEKKPCKNETDYFELGMYYFLEQKDYTQSKLYFQKAKKQEKSADAYVKLSEFMLNQSDDKDMEKVLRKIEKEADKEKRIEKKLMLARGCVLLEMDWAYEMIVEMYLNNPQEVSEERLKEWNEYKALAYEKLSLWKEAGTQYRILNEQEKKREEKEKMYREKYMEMDINYLKELWKKESFTMEEKQSILQNMVKENPQMKEEESFIRFLQDNHIQI